MDAQRNRTSQSSHGLVYNMNISLKKRSLIWWIVQTIPPLCILPLSTMPLDIITGIFWFVGTIAFLISILSIAYKVIKIYRVKIGLEFRRNGGWLAWFYCSCSFNSFKFFIYFNGSNIYSGR